MGVFHALAISRGNSLLKSHWIQDFLEFYGRNLFKAESSATCGTYIIVIHLRLHMPAGLEPKGIRLPMTGFVFSSRLACA